MANDSKARLLGNELVSGVVATTALGGLYLGLHFPAMVAAGVAIAVYGGTRLFFSATAGADHDDSVDRAVARGRQQVERLRKLSGSISKSDVRASVAHICIMAEQIFAIFLGDPAKAPLARGFVDYTLTQTTTIVTRYCELSSRSLSSATPTLERAESLLTMIEKSFAEQIEKLLSEDVADLDSEIEVLQARVELEGDLTE